MQPLISLVTVVYNGEMLIADTLRSAISQTYTNIELVIVDGGSTDHTVDVAKQFSAHIGSLISEKDKGIYDAMNKGILSARGEWVYFLNAGDSFYDANVLADIFNNVSNDVDLIYGKVQTVNEPTGINYINGNSVELKDFYHKYPICHQAAFFRKRAFDRIGLYNDTYKLVADSEWFVRFFQSGDFNAQFVDRIIAYYDIQGASYHKRMLSQRELLRYSNQYFPFSIVLFNKLTYPLVYLKVYIIRMFQQTAWFKQYRAWKFKNRKAEA
ncbi:MAG: glycosyltransferase family 2 protein [Bacteroidota bacterium]